MPTAQLIVDHYSRMFLTAQGSIDLLAMSNQLPERDFWSYIHACRAVRAAKRLQAVAA